jgi:hypothetical protein
MEPRRSTDRDADDDRNETAVDVDRALAALHGNSEETRPSERARPRPRRQSRPARPRRTTS